MKTNPILDEVWRIKDQLAAESGYDVNRFVEQLREWSAAHPPAGQIINTSEELHQLLADQESERDKQSAMTLNDKPPSTR